MGLRILMSCRQVVQENPRGLAEAIWAALQGDYAQEGPTSRL